MKKLLIGVLGVVVAAVAAALIAPSFIDWNAYRGEIATEVRKATGRKLAIDGSISVALLPAPQLSVSKVRLANVDGAKAPDMARLDALDVRIAFWPLLSGRVQVSSVVLRGADIEFEALADGRVNWDFSAPRKGAAPSSADSGGGAASQAAQAVRLDQVVISGGRVTYRDSQKNTVETVDGIEARLAAETLAGPFALRGRATLRGVPVAIEARLGHLAEGRASPLTATVELTKVKTKADIIGQVVATDAAPRADVKIQMEGENLAATLAALGGGGAGPGVLARKFTLSTALAGDARALAFNDMTLVLNGTRLTGAVSASFGTVPSVDATFAVNTLDLDTWLAAAATTAPAAPAPGKATPTPGNGTAAAAGFTLPDDLRVAFDARIGGITYRKGAIRNLTLQGQMDRGVVTLARAAAELPGGSDVSLNGRLATPGGAPRFDGRLDLNAADLRALLDWAGIDHHAVAADRLHKATFRTGVGVASERVELRDMDLRFDSTRVSGGVVVALRERLGIGANIVVDTINLDAYMAPPAKAKGAAATAPAQPAAAPAAAGGGLAAFDANIRASVGSMTAKGMALRGIAFDGSLIGGDLAVKSLSVADFAGGKLKLSGTIAGLDKNPVPDLRFALTTNAPDKLLAAAGLTTGIPAARLRPFALDGAFKAEARATRLDAKLAAGALRVALQGALTDLATAPGASLTLKADHPSYVDFVRLFMPDFSPRVAGKGPFSLQAKAVGAGLDVKLSDVAARFGPTSVTGAATLALAAARPKLTADFKADAIVADNFIPDSVGVAPDRAGAGAGAAPGAGAGAAGAAPWSDAPLDLDALRGFDADVKIEAKTLDWRAWRVSAPRIDMTLADGRFDLRRVSGKTVGGTFQATGMLAAPAKKGGAAELKADIDIARADLAKAMFNATSLDIAKGSVTFRMNLGGKGASSRALVSSLTGSGNLEAVDGAITGFDLGRVNNQLRNLNQPTAFLTLLQTAMSGGTTKFSKLGGTFRIENGVLRSDDVALAADGGTGSATVTADLPKWRIDAQGLFRLTGHKDAPAFRMALKGPLDRPSRIFNVNELQSWLVGKAAGGLLQQFIDKKKPQQQNAAPSQPSQPSAPKSEEFIRGIFDLLQKKK